MAELFEVIWQNKYAAFTDRNAKNYNLRNNPLQPPNNGSSSCDGAFDTQPNPPRPKTHDFICTILLEFYHRRGIYKSCLSLIYTCAFPAQSHRRYFNHKIKNQGKKQARPSTPGSFTPTARLSPRTRPNADNLKKFYETYKRDTHHCIIALRWDHMTS